MAEGGNNGRTTGGRFGPGNPGRPKGARHKTTLLAEKLMADDAEQVVRAVLEAAKNGDIQAAKVVLDRMAPARRDSPVTIDIPRIEKAADAARAFGAILEAVGSGAISPSEGQAVAGLIEGYVKTLEASQFEDRIAALEARGAK